MNLHTPQYHLLSPFEIQGEKSIFSSKGDNYNLINWVFINNLTRIYMKINKKISRGPLNVTNKSITIQIYVRFLKIIIINIIIILSRGFHTNVNWSIIIIIIIIMIKVISRKYCRQKKNECMCECHFLIIIYNDIRYEISMILNIKLIFKDTANFLKF